MRSRFLAALLAAAVLGPWPVSARAEEGVTRRPKLDIPGVVYHGPRDQKRIALTFDACSSPRGDRVDQRVVDALIAMQVPATLFLGGKWMVDDPQVVDILRQTPQFELATHGYLHPHLVKMSSQEVQNEVERAAHEFEEKIGRKPALIRAPYGELDARVAKVLEQQGLTPVQFDLPGADSTFSKQVLVKWVISQAKPGSIVVLHMNGHGKHTAEALPEIVNTLRGEGYTFVTVSQLLGRDSAMLVEPVLASINPAPPEPIYGPFCSIADGDP